MQISHRSRTGVSIVRSLERATPRADVLSPFFGAFTIDFAGCMNDSTFNLNVPFSADGGITGTLSLQNLAQQTKGDVYPPSTVPEPSFLWLMTGAIAAILLLRRARFSAHSH